MSDDVTVEIRDGVAEVRLSRPQRRNALTMSMFEDLAEAAESLEPRNDLRAVIICGEGESFCSGLDTSNFSGDADEAATSPRLARLLRSATENDPGHEGNLGQYAVQVWSQLPVPVIAAVSGHALGAGLQLALAADLRIVAPTAALSVLEIRWGLVPDLGGLPLLIDLVGPELALDLALTGRMVPGEEARDIGLAGRVSEEPLVSARELAETIAGRSPDAVRQIKRLARLAGKRPLAAQLADEAHVLEHLRSGSNHREAVSAFLEKRPPEFTDPVQYQPDEGEQP